MKTVIDLSTQQPYNFYAENEEEFKATLNTIVQSESFDVSNYYMIIVKGTVDKEAMMAYFNETFSDTDYDFNIQEYTLVGLQFVLYFILIQNKLTRV